MNGTAKQIEWASQIIASSIDGVEACLPAVLAEIEQNIAACERRIAATTDDAIIARKRASLDEYRAQADAATKLLRFIESLDDAAGIINARGDLEMYPSNHPQNAKNNRRMNCEKIGVLLAAMAGRKMFPGGPGFWFSKLLSETTV